MYNTFMKEKMERAAKFALSFSVKLIIAGVIGFILYGIGRSVWKNYQVVEKIDSLESEIFKEKENNENLKNLLVYYQTDSYKELELRKKLNYKKQGEKVVIIPELNPVNQEEQIEKQLAEKKKEIEEPNVTKWYKYILGK